MSFICIEIFELVKKKCLKYQMGLFQAMRIDRFSLPNILLIKDIQSIVLEMNFKSRFFLDYTKILVKHSIEQYMFFFIQ